MKDVEQPEPSTARRRKAAASNGDQWHEVQEQLLKAFDALAVSAQDILLLSFTASMSMVSVLPLSLSSSHRRSEGLYILAGGSVLWVRMWWLRRLRRLARRQQKGLLRESRIRKTTGWLSGGSRSAHKRLRPQKQCAPVTPALACSAHHTVPCHNAASIARLVCPQVSGR